ncbi:MAG TPA: permease [Spirochaetota bacterium]|nr:permease [Spirochaetota bacterium]HPV40125.1 permease [Spirochaetota bacterium]
MNAQTRARIATGAAFGLFIAVSHAAGFNPGISIGRNARTFLMDMIMVLPCAFILIGLFESWVDRERIERHLGAAAGIKGHLWAIALASLAVGGLIVALPVGYSLHKKGASPAVIYTFLGAAAVCRFPMVLFEASFLGIGFTLARMAVALPLVLVFSGLLARLTAGGAGLFRDVKP